MKNYRVEKPKSQKSNLTIERDKNVETVLISIDDFNQ
jgi:hypothetical protein